MTPLLATVLLDPPTALITGSGLALFSLKMLRKSPEAETRRLALLGAAWGAWYAVCVSWMFFQKTDWMLVYLADGKDLPVVPAFALFMAICAFFGVVGALATSWLVATGRLGLGIALFLGTVVTVGVIGLLQGDAYLHVGSLAEYRAGTAPHLKDLPEMQKMMNLSGALSAPPAFALLAWNFLRGRKA